MSKELVKEVLQLDSMDKVRDLLNKRKAEIGDSFLSSLLQVSNQYRAEKNYDDAIKPLRIAFESGQITQNIYFRAFSRLQVAYVEFHFQSFDKCMSMVRKCISECDNVSDERSTKLKADAYYLLGYIQQEQFGQSNDSLKSLQTAQILYGKLQQEDKVSSIQKYIAQIQQQIDKSPVKPLGDDLNNIIKLREELSEIQSAIATNRSTLVEIQKQHGKVEEELKKLLTRRQSLIDEKTDFESQIDELKPQLEWIQSQLKLMLLVRNVPLWSAAVRVELAEGEITNLTLPLLERLRSASPEYAQPLIAEIRARNGIPTDYLIDLSNLDGEQRLFAGVANSVTLETEDPLAAVEVLLDSWETYLISPSGTVQ